MCFVGYNRLQDQERETNGSHKRWRMKQDEAQTSTVQTYKVALETSRDISRAKV